MQLSRYILVIIALSFCSHSSAEIVSNLAIDRSVSTEGFVTISWETAETLHSVNLEISTDPLFKNTTGQALKNVRPRKELTIKSMIMAC